MKKTLKFSKVKNFGKFFRVFMKIVRLLVKKKRDLTSVTIGKILWAIYKTKKRGKEVFVT